MNKDNFQGTSVPLGKRFELSVEQELQKTGEILARNYIVPETGCEADFVVKVKGKTVYVECKGGNPLTKRRPGAERTDSVKKAIANGALIKAVNPKSKYIVYFSAPPKKHSASDIMINVALKNKIIDEVKYFVD